MKIYGVAILAACFLAGQFIGDLLGKWLHIDGNIGGVGFSMLLLILLSDWLKDHHLLGELPRKGILFWTAMYIPVVVAMSSTLNVKAAVKGGWVALLVGLVATVLLFILVPLLAGKKRRETV